ncbi:MAG: hypothetical protein Q7T55_23540 [Solirubrobacteraceae bacterium]|nr:hypothetical protein [Solirubrobacteraceae bacterium]
MTASHLPPRNGHVPSSASTNGNGAVPGRTGSGDADEPLEGPAPTRGERLVALTEPGPLTIRWGLVVIASLVIAGVLTAALGGAPTYDPWAWIIWGREIIHGDLVTTAGPSWKPLPMIFTIPFALFGEAAPDLWMWIARATALIGIVAVADLAARLGGRLAAALAAVAITLMPLYYAYGVQGSSEGALVLVCCLAATSWMDERRTAAFWWLVAAALLRPEAWFFVAVVGIERLWNSPKRITWIGASGLVVLAAWLVPEKIGSGAYLRAATRAHDPNPESAAFAKSPTLEVLGSMGNLMLWLPLIGVGCALVLGFVAWRRQDAEDGGWAIDRSVLRKALFLSALAAGWIAIVAAMTEGGYAGNPRYLAAPLGLMAAVGLAGIAWLVRQLGRSGAASVGELLVMGALVVMVIVAALRLPGRTEEITYQSANRAQLTSMEHVDGFRKELLACGPLVAHPLMVPPIAWTFDLHMEDVISDEPAPPVATYVLGTNAASRPVRPKVPTGVPLDELRRTSQITVVRNCTP